MTILERFPERSSGRSLSDETDCIRQGTEADAEFFFALEEQTTWESLPQSCGTAWQRDIVREALCATHRLMLQVPGNIFFIAEVASKYGRERAGLLWFGPKRNAITGEEEGWIYNVTVVPAHRGCGIAKRLLRHAEEYARQEGYRVIGLSVASHNAGARTLYEATGYAESNILLRKPLDGDKSQRAEPGCAVCEAEGSA